ncbi:putative glutamine amidotransferase-like protein C13C5.04 [Aspergillus udagawae]|nr:putative glutamine amidotransferase-like protein C13C5.04 [Aspergillus udagawae]
MHLHIAILDLDVPVPTVYATRGLYSSQFTRLLVSAAARLSQSLNKEITISTSSYDAVGGILPPAHLLHPSPPGPGGKESEKRSINGILLTGSSASVYRADQHPWISSLQAFLNDVYVNYPHIKLFGSCFGHQMLARTLVPGCMVEACPGGYEVGVHAIALEGEFVTRFGFPLLSSLISAPAAEGPGRKEMRLQLVHGDWVVSERGLPDDWVNVGSTSRCPIQGLYRPGRVLTFQGHFEFDVFVNRETCLEFGRRWGWDGEVVEGYLRAIEAGDGEDDAEVAAEMVVCFFAGEDMRAPDSGQREAKMMEGGLLTPPSEEQCPSPQL